MTISLLGVTIRYGRRIAVNDLTVELPAGVVGLLGRNGAGKTSILKAMLGLVQPERGRMRIPGVPEGCTAAELRARLGYMPERDAHLPQATGFETVTLLGMLSGLARDDARRRAHEALYLVGIEEQRYRDVAGYSAGMRQRVKLAAALVHDPAVLFLDEPTNGLDPQGRAEMLRLIGELSRTVGKSIVLSTHILQDVEAVCDSAVVIEQGRVVAQGRLEDLVQGGSTELRLEIEPGTVALASDCVPSATIRCESDGVYSVVLGEGADRSRLFEAVRCAGGVVRGLVARRRSLEDVFLSVVGGAGTKGDG